MSSSSPLITSVKGLIEALRDARAAAAASAETVASLTSQVGSLTTQTVALTTRLQEIAVENSTLHTNCSQIERERAALKAQTDAAHSTLKAQVEADLTTLKAQVEGERATHKSQLDAQIGINTMLQSRTRELEGVISAQSAKIEDLTELCNSQAEHMRATTPVQQELEELRQQVNDLIAEKHELKTLVDGEWSVLDTTTGTADNASSAVSSSGDALTTHVVDTNPSTTTAAAAAAAASEPAAPVAADSTSASSNSPPPTTSMLGALNVFSYWSAPSATAAATAVTTVPGK